MSFLSALKDWEYLAKKDPLWAILSDPAKKDGRWQLDEFFAEGKREIESVMQFLARRGMQPVDFQSAVDFGCGVGRLSRALAPHFERVYAVDAAPTMIERARELNGEHANIEFVLNREPRLSRFADGSVSFVYTNIVLQHITYPESLGYVEEFMRVVKPGGVAVFQTPTLDRTPLPMRLLRAAVRRAVRVAQLPFDAFYMDMNTIPVSDIERVAVGHRCEILERFNVNRNHIGDDGTLRERRAPWFERLVSECFIARKHVSP